MFGGRNVVLVTVDCLRADHLPCYGYDRDTAPVLSDLAEDSVVFENAFATGPGTSVSFPSIFTGTYPFEFGGYGRLSEGRTPIAEVLSEAGVHTIGVHSNTYLSRAFGYERGFDVYESFYDRPDGLVRLEQAVRNRLDDEGLVFRTMKRVYESVLERATGGGGGEAETDDGDGAGDGFSLPYEQADSVTDTVIEHLEDVSEPFFCWTHYMDVHAPHRPPDRHFEGFGGDPPDWAAHHDRWLAAKERPVETTDAEVAQFVDAYDAEIRFVDEQLSRLFDWMVESGHHEDTVYIITADHGELLGEHGQFSHPPRLFEELVHVPLLVHAPGVTDGRRVEELVSLIDLPTTIAEVFDASVPDSYRGTSLATATSDGSAGRKFVFSEVCHRPGEGFSAGAFDLESAIVACRSPRDAYVRDAQRDEEEFYVVESVTESPTEGSVSKSRRRALREAVDSHLETVADGEEALRHAEIDETTAERLRDLGYAE